MRASIVQSIVRPRWLLALLVLIALLAALLAPPLGARAHPLDEYLQATYITVAPTRIEVEIDLTPGVLIAPQILSILDADGDRQLTEAETRAYVATLLDDVSLKVDGQPLVLDVARIEMPPYLNLQAGYGTIRVFTVAALTNGAAGLHQIAYGNVHAPAKSTYQVNTFVDRGDPITLGTQNRDRLQQRLTVDFAVASSIPESPSLADTPVATTAGAAGQAGELLAYLDPPTLGPWELLIALAIAGLLGGLHALTPGHGKTLVAAYLVGSRGTVRHAVALGSIVTFTHTASVILIGLLALFASQYVVPDVLVPVLEVLSGMLVMVLGVRLVWQRWGVLHWRRGAKLAPAPASPHENAPVHDPDHSHDHPHAHTHPHAHLHDHAPVHTPDHEHEHGLEHGHSHPLGYTHDHGDGHVHTHLPPAEGVRLGSLLAMGVSGGLVPCPEALGIMIIAIGLNRILLGLGLIVSFSFGLAAVLIIIGVLLVRSRTLVERFGGLGGRLSTWLPLGSAVIVTVLGAGIAVRGLLAYLT